MGLLPIEVTDDIRYLFVKKISIITNYWKNIYTLAIYEVLYP